MLNQTKRVFTHKSKSKIFITILCIFGLLFSYSCSCKNNVTGPGNDGLENGKVTNIDATLGTFAPRLDLGNSYNVSFTSAGVEKLHASVKFIEQNKYGYKAEITEVTDEKGEITKEKIQYNEDGTFTIAQATLQALAGKLDSTDKPATNKASITFKLTSTDTSLNNNTTNITETFYFIKAKKIDKNNIQSILRKGNDYTQISNTFTGKDYSFHFHFKNGDYQEVGNNFVVTNNATNNLDISKSKAKDYIGYNFNTILTNEGIKGTPSTVDYESEGTDFYTLSYDITYGDLYEGDITPIKVKLENKSTMKFVE